MPTRFRTPGRAARPYPGILQVYRFPLIGRPFFLAIFAVFGVAAVAMMASVFAGGDDSPPVAFALLWLAILVWNGYWWLLRIAFSVALDGDEFAWSAPLRSGRIPLRKITVIRPMRLGSNVEVIEHEDGRPVLILATKGLSGFLAELSKHRPDLEVRVGWQARLAERLPGWSGWKHQGHK